MNDKISLTLKNNIITGFVGGDHGEFVVDRKELVNILFHQSKFINGQIVNDFDLKKRLEELRNPRR